MPTGISINGSGGNGTISYIYDSTGTKLRKKVVETGKPDRYTYYAGNYVYEGSSLKYLSQPEGYVDTENGFDYVYQYRDHLGNVRLSYSDSDGNGTIDPNTEIISESNYYPFGLLHRGYNELVSANANSVASKFKFNGVELEEALGLDLYEMTWRNYDASLGRFKQIDPFAEYYGQYDKSPFAFAWNNPIVFKDPSGLCPDCGKPGEEGSTYTIENESVYVVVNGEWEKQIEKLPEVVINTSSTNIEELQSLGAGSLGANIGGNTVAPILENSIPNLGKNDFLLGRIDPKYATDFNNSATSTEMGNVYEKGADDALRALNKVRVATKLVGTVANVAGYSTAVSEAANGNYGGAAIEGTSASISWKLGSIYWMYGIAWSAGWEGGRAITNTEAYNRKAFGIYSDIYIQRKIANNWGPLTPLQQHLVEARKL